MTGPTDEEVGQPALEELLERAREAIAAGEGVVADQAYFVHLKARCLDRLSRDQKS